MTKSVDPRVTMVLDLGTSGENPQNHKYIVSPHCNASGRDRPSTAMHVARDFDADPVGEEASSEKAQHVELVARLWGIATNNW